MKELKESRFPEMIRELRRDKGVSQQRIANYLNVSQVAYSKYETGKNEPSNDVLLKLADYFNVSVDFLLGRRIKGYESLIPEDYYEVVKEAQRVGLTASDLLRFISLCRDIRRY